MKRDRGFTVIEVTLFLGISGLLFVIALLGTGAFVREARFGDSMRRLESFLQSQYEEVVNGVNPRPGTVGCNGSSGNVSTGSPTQPGTSNTCLLMGKAILFNEDSDTVESYYILGLEPTTPDPTLPVTAVIDSYNPRIVASVGQDSFVTPWGALYRSGRKSVSPPEADSIAFIRSPFSSQVITYIFRTKGNPDGGWFAGGGGPTSNPSQTTNASASFCFQSVDNDKVAAIQIGQGQGSNIISTKYDTTVAASC